MMLEEPAPTTPSAVETDRAVPDLVVIVNNSVDPPTVTPVGRLEKSTAAQLQDVVRQVLAEGPVDIVLSDLTKMDADGLRALATLRWRDSDTAEVHFKRVTTSVDLPAEVADEPVMSIEFDYDDGSEQPSGAAAHPAGSRR